MQGNQITDKNIALSMLDDLKFTANCLNGKILEAADDQLRRDYMSTLERTYQLQKQVWNLAHQRGWYQPMMAEQQQITSAQNQIRKTDAEMHQFINSTAGMNQQSGMYQQSQYNYQTPNYQQQTYYQGSQPGTGMTSPNYYR